MPLESDTLADKAFDRIEAAIIKGEFPPGTRISEALLARRLGISRGPLREAIRRLEGRKLVKRVPHLGPRVATWSREDFEEIFLVREALEGMACRLATEKMTADELSELEASVERHDRETGGKAESLYFPNASHLDFHYRVALASRNSKLIELLGEDLYSLIRVYRYRSASKPGRIREAFEEHRHILAAMRARDPGLAEKLMREHIAGARKMLSATDVGLGGGSLPVTAEGGGSL